MRRAISIAGLVAAFFVLTPACGGVGGGEGGEPSAPETGAEATTAAAAAADTLPEQPGPIPAGEYRTDEFEPAFSFRVGEGWAPLGPELPEILDIGTERGGGLVAVNFVKLPEKVIDPNRPEKQKEVPAPEDADGWVAWFREHPYLDTTQPRPVTVGGVSGVRFGTTVTSAPKKVTGDMPCTGCVPFFRLSDGGRYDFLLGPSSRDIVLDVGDETVGIRVEPFTEDAAKFEEKLLPEAQKVLDTVEWEAGS